MGALDDDAKKATERRTDKTVEPVTFHGTPRMTWDEILNIAGGNSAMPRLVVELVATDETLAMICLEKKVPYMGSCFNGYHRDMLRNRCAQKVFQSMQATDSPFSTAEDRTKLNTLLGK